MEKEIYEVLRRHRLPLKKREDVITDLLKIVNNVSGLLESSLGECVEGNDYEVVADKDGSFWINHKEVGSGEPLKQWIDGALNVKPTEKRSLVCDRGFDVHELKIWPEFYEAVKSGEKTFEVRKHDRNFKVGDWLFLACFNPNTNEYDRRGMIKCEVTYLLPGGSFGVKDGFCVLGIKNISHCR